MLRVARKKLAIRGLSRNRERDIVGCVAVGRVFNVGPAGAILPRVGLQNAQSIDNQNQTSQHNSQEKPAVIAVLTHIGSILVRPRSFWSDLRERGLEAVRKRCDRVLRFIYDL